ncbi:hypothetical protein DFH09DRAFT_1069405 [Mycena vulgaris]|nr:hypothetical protein DFH09DRAFT_1069405 [Mycena vulgaris]
MTKMRGVKYQEQTKPPINVAERLIQAQTTKRWSSWGRANSIKFHERKGIQAPEAVRKSYARNPKVHDRRRIGMRWENECARNSRHSAAFRFVAGCKPARRVHLPFTAEAGVRPRVRLGLESGGSRRSRHVKWRREKYTACEQPGSGPSGRNKMKMAQRRGQTKRSGKGARSGGKAARERIGRDAAELRGKEGKGGAERHSRAKCCLRIQEGQGQGQPWAGFSGRRAAGSERGGRRQRGKRGKRGTNSAGSMDKRRQRVAWAAKSNGAAGSSEQRCGRERSERAARVAWPPSENWAQCRGIGGWLRGAGRSELALDDAYLQVVQRLGGRIEALGPVAAEEEEGGGKGMGK